MISVLRLGHRISRDKRISTHVCLVARAFGADEVIMTGEKDDSLLRSVNDVSDSWGGEFKIRYEKGWRPVLKEFKEKGYEIVHLTMYGLPIQKKLKELKSPSDKLVVVGGEKVPGEVYEIADYNIGVGSQPHSEVAALAITLDRIMDGIELDAAFDNAKKRVVPQKKGKKVIESR
jgi:tRNA (cytidine56-2'-O)-methyltransferase